jgi:hypothetical protein
MVIYPKVKFSLALFRSITVLFHLVTHTLFSMISSGIVQLSARTAFYSLSAAVALSLLLVKPMLAQSVSVPDDQTLQQNSNQPSTSDPNDLRPLNQDSSLLSIRGGQRLMTEATSAVSDQNYDLAVRKLQEARQVFNQISNFYQELAASFSGIDNRIADAQRRQALEAAQMRDQATYQLALVHRAQNKPELAVPLLVQIIRSQQPTRELGQQAYRQLFELGFVNSPYPRNPDDAPTSNAPAPSRSN